MKTCDYCTSESTYSMGVHKLDGTVVDIQACDNHKWFGKNRQDSILSLEMFGARLRMFDARGTYPVLYRGIA